MTADFPDMLPGGETNHLASSVARDVMEPGRRSRVRDLKKRCATDAGIRLLQSCL
jgi:hypothetical protein